MSLETAIKLVGDGDGKIDLRLHQELGNEAQTQFQTRFGIKEKREGLNDESKPLDSTWQLGKGTFAPRDLSKIVNGYDLVISTEQLKGRVREEERGKEEGANISSSLLLKPGEYTMKIGIGNKTDAYYGITSTGSQFWNSFPNGVKGDVIPRLEQRLEELKEMTNDPRKIAQDYVRSIDVGCMDRNLSDCDRHFLKEYNDDFIDFDHLNLEEFEKLIDRTFGDSDRNMIYRILRADLEGHYQLLEHPKIIDKLQEHWRKQYLDCASGRFIKFDSAMAQTCHELAANEVCYPNLPDGEEVIIYRGPTANSNTINIFVNRHLDNEPFDKGTIKMSPQGLKISLSDCDGDRMSIALASEFPHTTTEIKQKQFQENRYKEIIKLAKKSYEGSFEQIALQAMENKVGLIANLCMKGIALENECLCIPQNEAADFIRSICQGIEKMLAAETDKQYPVQYPDRIKKQILEISDLCKLEALETNQNNILEKSCNLYHDVVGILGGELQIEVDRGKSANRSNPEIINACKIIVTNPDIAPWVEERKIDEVFSSRKMNIKGHGAIDMLVKMTNEAFAESSLIPRSTQQFQDLFKGVQFSPQEKLKAIEIKKEYDALINRAITTSRELEQTTAPRIIVTSCDGSKIDIIGLPNSLNSHIFDTNKNFNIKIVTTAKVLYFYVQV
ncbi:MAG: hypothetical protein HC903_32570 [Methylacidiphilales bacterium]|nr:hypothetical protein [Candidatus Methylacidiphilales bacterium]